MKLNPPETAPKDGSIFLSATTGSNILRDTLWNSYMGKFETTVYRRCLTYPGDNYELEQKEYFIIDTFMVDETLLLGWLPRPEIDDEGNVK